MNQLGKTSSLEVVKQVPFGYYLNAHELGQVLLPNKLAPKDCQVGDKVEVFLHLDSEDKVIATTRTPKAEVGQLASLKVVSTSRFGAFLDWGLDKDLLLPFAEQAKPLEVGNYALVYVHINRADDRIVASAKIDKFFDKTPPFYKEGEQVDLVIAGRTDLGYKAVINGAHWGVLYKDEVFQVLKPGFKTKGYIKRMRSDGKIDLQLSRGSKVELDSQSLSIMIKLKQAGGFLPLTDKTDAEVIYQTLAMSKKAFKKCIGGLYKQQKIAIETTGIRLIEE
ncbi:S1 RNA-binding domain-containing protein [Shewanella sp. NIFS-20-20]|uniref:CvfB family protein n=1 Tax=Shewanella sp. NIFS-20-20 TaxID=2853806 RepID=UPI001C47FBB4|nr:S1-like domain-containing RNA-binding protein [Shewanella sp. NIFS-20-20]MBV7314375.1 GntR family transcriptional regulator [Shewanella sp. NIFS-20-20]